MHLLLQQEGGAQHLFIGLDFMGRSRGGGRQRVGLGGGGGAGREAALCFVAHVAASQQVREGLGLVTATSSLRISQVNSTVCYYLPEPSLQQIIPSMGEGALKKF